MAKHKVRTTFRPDRVVEVGDAERLDLERQGLLAREDTKAERMAGGRRAESKEG